MSDFFHLLVWEPIHLSKYQCFMKFMSPEFSTISKYYNWSILSFAETVLYKSNNERKTHLSKHKYVSTVSFITRVCPQNFLHSSTSLSHMTLAFSETLLSIIIGKNMITLPSSQQSANLCKASKLFLLHFHLLFSHFHYFYVEERVDIKRSKDKILVKTKIIFMVHIFNLLNIYFPFPLVTLNFQSWSMISREVLIFF